MRKSPIVLLSAIISISAFAQTSSDQALESFLRDFHANPQVMMRKLPSEVDVNGRILARGEIQDETVNAQLEDRYEMRWQIIRNSLPNFSTGWALPIDEFNTADRIIEPGPIVSNLRDLEVQQLTRATLPVAPWDDSYWPIYKGLLAQRYADSFFSDKKRWPEYFSYSQSRPATMIWQYGSSSEIDNLSPAEKYDIAMGDSNFTLTNYSWNVGRNRLAKVGVIPRWTGICHGWAGASHMMAGISQQPVQVTTPGGRPITFYPADIKALQSMLWANAPPPSRFVGKRCDTFKPPRDANGRIIDPRCFETNPATWHLIATNQLGIHKRSFVLDGVYDAEVWNFPVYSYQYTYFNPQSLKAMRNLNGAVVPIQNFSLDKFKAYRSPEVKFVAGISMDVTYTIEINPHHGNPSAQPLMKTVRLIYDLELDDNLNVIGGEWYSQAHPDFIWTFAADAQAMTSVDRNLISDPWTISSPVPASWGGFAQKASSRGAPLFSFIRQLIGPTTPPVAPTPTPVPNPPTP